MENHTLPQFMSSCFYILQSLLWLLPLVAFDCKGILWLSSGKSTKCRLCGYRCLLRQLISSWNCPFVWILEFSQDHCKRQYSVFLPLRVQYCTVVSTKIDAAQRLGKKSVWFMCRLNSVSVCVRVCVLAKTPPGPRWEPETHFGNLYKRIGEKLLSLPAEN